MRLTVADMEFLMEAVDAKLHAGAKSDMLHMTMVAMMSRSKEDADAELAKCKREMDGKKNAHRVMEERCTLLKAKLIQMRDERDLESLFDNSSKENAQ
ncbi:MAG: hypothetical protein WCY09_08490 [Candidatus Omnitrophota bacterium]